MIKILFILLLTGCATQKSIVVNLDGSNSNGNGISFYWKQVGGAAMVISKPNDAKASFKVSKTGVYKFELTVIDENGFSDSDTTMITVK